VEEPKYPVGEGLVIYPDNLMLCIAIYRLYLGLAWFCTVDYIARTQCGRSFHDMVLVCFTGC
jgi:hypothetical protein